MTTATSPRPHSHRRAILIAIISSFFLCFFAMVCRFATMSPEERATLATTVAQTQVARTAERLAQLEADQAIERTALVVARTSVAATRTEEALATTIPMVESEPTVESETAGATTAKPAPVIDLPGLGVTRQHLEDNIGPGFYASTNVIQQQPDGSTIELKRTMVEGGSALNDDKWAAEVIGPDENVQTVSALFDMSWTEEGIRYGPMVMYKIALAALPVDEEYLAVAEFIERSADGIVAAHQAGDDIWEDKMALDGGRRVEVVALLMDDGAVCTFSVTAKPSDEG